MSAILQRLKNLFRRKNAWTPIERGPANIHGYKLERIVRHGTYVKETNAKGAVRYWIHEPGMEPYLTGADHITRIDTNTNTNTK